MTEFLFGHNERELTTEIECELYKLRRHVCAGFFLPPQGYDKELKGMRSLQSCRVNVFAVISTEEPVQALIAFLDAADICREIRLLSVPQESIRQYGQECYDRLLAKAREISEARGIALETDYIL